MLVTGAVLRQCRHMQRRTVALVRGETIVRKARMNIEHVGIARSLRENRRCAYFLNVCISTRLRDDDDVA